MFPLLETLVAVYEGQFTLAADELKVSQSTVSSRIAQLSRWSARRCSCAMRKSDVTPHRPGGCCTRLPSASTIMAGYASKHRPRAGGA